MCLKTWPRPLRQDGRDEQIKMAATWIAGVAAVAALAAVAAFLNDAGEVSAHVTCRARRPPRGPPGTA